MIHIHLAPNHRVTIVGDNILIEPMLLKALFDRALKGGGDGMAQAPQGKDEAPAGGVRDAGAGRGPGVGAAEGGQPGDQAGAEGAARGDAAGAVEADFTYRARLIDALGVNLRFTEIATSYGLDEIGRLLKVPRRGVDAATGKPST